MAINKVVYGNDTLIDLTEDTVAPENLLSGATAHNAAGNRITGIAKPGVQSFNGRSGSVLPIAGDYSADQVDYDSNKTVKQVIDALATKEASDIAGQQSLLKDTVGWTGKNRLNIPDKTLTSNGVTININNGVASFSGTNALSSALWIAGTGINIPKGTYIFSGLDTTQSIVTNLQLLQSDNTEIVTINLHDSSKTVIIPNDLSDCKIHFRIVANGNTNGIKAYPMLRKADITDPTYESYHESVGEEIEQVYADNGVLGAKNLLENTANTRTINGVTFTVNADKSVTANGTATADATFTLLADYADLEKGVYKITGCPTGGTATTYEIFTAVRHLDATATEFVRDFGNGASLTVDNNTRNIALSIIVRNNTTVSNIVFKPMLRLASNPDDTYQPYAMTNRELTELAGRAVTYPLEWNSDLNLDTNKSGRLHKYGKIYLVSYGFKATTAFSGNIPIIKMPKNGLVNGNYAIVVNDNGVIFGGKAQKDGDDYVSISGSIVVGNWYRAQCILFDLS